MALSSNDDKTIQSIDLRETYECEKVSKKYIRILTYVSKKEEIKCNNIIKQYKNDQFLKLLFYTPMTWMIFTKILNNTTQSKKRKILVVFDDMIASMLNFH